MPGSLYDQRSYTYQDMYVRDRRLRAVRRPDTGSQKSSLDGGHCSESALLLSRCQTSSMTSSSSAGLVTRKHQLLSPFQVRPTTDCDLKAPGAKMADLGYIAGEARLQGDA